MKVPMLAIGFAASFVLATGAAQAQGAKPNAISQSQASGAAMNSSSESAQKPSKVDKRFLTEAMQGDMAEIQMGKLAQQKSQSEDLKQFGQMLEQDHSQHLQQAQQEAQQFGIAPPQGPSASQKATYDRMNKLAGAQFDHQFAKHAVQDHKKDIAEYQKMAKSKGPLAQFAQQTVPTLQKHLQTAQSIESKGAMTGSKSGTK